MPSNPPEYPNGTADDTSKDAAEIDTKTYSINYDPNEGVITYGVVGNVGARAENDINNERYRGTKYKLFPSYYASLTNDKGELLFPDYDGTPHYDYSEMLTYAINEEANNHVKGADTYEIRVEEGVYYFGQTVKIWGMFNLNGIYGKTVFVTEKNDEGAFVKAGSNQTYLQGSITDITFVAKDAHGTFVPTQTAKTIHENALDYSVQPIENHACFMGMNISWFTLKNCTFSGFSAPLKGVKGHMCSHIQNNTFGPCRVALDGLHFIDCFIHDNYFMGVPIKKDGHMDLPLFTTGIGPNLTTINNNYIQNFFYGQGQSDTYGVAYTNNTYDRVYGIEFYTAGDATNAVSQCLFKNNAYKDIASFFESFGYTPYSLENTGENAYVIHALSYDHKDNLSGIAFNKVKDYNKSYIINLAGGTTITQCKFDIDDMTDTELFIFGYTSNEYRDRGATGTQILDNAYEIDVFQKDSILRDNINLRNNSLKNEWDTKYFLSKKTSKEACIYYSPNGNIKIDLSCFFDPSSNETLGYRSLSGSVGANEALLNTTVAEQYFKDLQAGRKVVYLSDFGATADDYSGDSMSIQKAFDTIAETGDILIVEGTYNITTPILLRGGKTYRVVCNGGKTSQNHELVGGGFALNVQEPILAKTGAFVQDKDDTGNVGGYFLNWNVYPNNIGQNIPCIERTGAVFYQVRFDRMHISNYRFGNTETVFEECTFYDSIIERGYSHYSPYGIMKRCIFTNSVLRHAYATGSLCDYGIGFTYAYYLVDTDFVNSTMRGNWIEFMQMSNGFRLKGDGNSLYTGNIWDYVWNFQFGRNDIFAGNNLTHCATVSITNHLQGPDGISRDRWTSEIRAGNITSMHVSDGVKIVGNVFSDGSTQYTTYFNFDGRTSLYNYGGKTVTSISDARIAANIGGNASNAYEMVQVICADTLLKENCRNNLIDLTSMAKSKKYFPAAQSYAYNATSLEAHVIPGTLAYVWGPEESALHYYGSVDTPKNVTKLPGQSLVFDLEYKLEDTSTDLTNRLTVYTYDFANYDTLQITKNGVATSEPGDIVSSYKKRIGFVSPLNDVYLEPIVSLASAEQNPDDVRVLYTETAYLNSEVIKENKARSSLPPIYLFSDTEHKNQYFTFSADLIAPVGSNPVGDFPIVIYGEDDTYYYGVQFALQNSYALRAKNFKIKKEVNGIVYGVNNMTGGVVPREFGTTYKVSATDISATGKGKQGNNVNGNIFFDGSNTEASKDNSSILVYDTDNLNSPILGMRIECSYGYTQNAVEVYAVLDFGNMIIANDGVQKVSERKVFLGSFPLEGIDTAPGILFFNDAWIESVSYGVDPIFDRTKVEEIKPEEEETERCSHVFTEYIRVKATCKTDGYDSYICSRCKTQLSYVRIPAGHFFKETIIPPVGTTQGYTKHECTECGYSYNDSYVSLPTATPVPTDVPMATATPPATSVPRPTSTPRPTLTPRPTATSAPRPTVTPRPTSTPRPTATPRPTVTPRVTATPKPTVTPKVTVTPSPTAKPTATVAPTKAPIVTATPVPTKAPEATVSPTPAMTMAPEATVAPKPTETVTPMPTEAVTPTRIPMPTSTPEVTETPIPTNAPEVTATAVPTKTPEATDTPAPTKAPTATATPRPTKAPRATATPVPTESPEPTASPKLEPITKETGDLVITVTDERSGAGREGVEIELLYPSGEAKQYVTNANGKIYLYELQPGNYEATPYIDINGHRIAIGIKEEINIRKNATELYDITMDFTLYDTAEVDVKPTDTKDVVIPIAVAGVILFAGIVVFFCRKRR